MKFQKSKTKKVMSWSTYLRLITRLYYKIDWEHEEFDTIVAINRGGNIIGTILSHRTRLPLEVIKKDHVLSLRGKVLIVDDISDTGSTLLHAISNLKSGTSYRTATLHIQPHTKHKPSYYVSTVRKWVVYPYENYRKNRIRRK